MKKHIVIISSVIFPRITPRAMRATELAKEFARQGHHVTLYSVLGQYDYQEFQETHNITVKNLGPMRFFKLNSDGKDEGNGGMLYRIFRKLFKRSVEFPDIELAFKTNTILKKEINIDLLITVAIPFPIHWGAAYRKEKSKNTFAKTWVADCGDPYMGNTLHKRPFYFKYIEKWFCRKADYISIPISGAKEAYYSEFHDKIKIIPQGFDFSNKPVFDSEPNNQQTTFIYAGVFYSGIRDPRPFLDFLAAKKDLNFLFRIYTKSKDILAPYKKILGDKLDIRDYIPRDILLQEMAKADFLINFENNTEIQSPSKLIDYALTKRPILSLNTTKKLDTDLITAFLNGDYRGTMQVGDIEQYNIKNVAKSFLALCEQNVKLD